MDPASKGVGFLRKKQDMETTLTAQQEFIEASIRFVKELKKEDCGGFMAETILDEMIQDVVFSVMYKDGAATRRINKLKKSC
jgi:hypothetical protein